MNRSFRGLLAGVGILLALGSQPLFAGVTVSVQPPSATTQVGSNVVFTSAVFVNAGEVITGYTWLTSSNGLNPFRTLPSTSATCPINNAQVGDSGYYFVRVSYTSGTNTGTAVSTSVQLTVQDQARIVSQPQGGFVALGTNVVLSVGALGKEPLSFQWRFKGVDLADDQRITGSRTGTLQLGGVQFSDSGSYDVVVSNAFASVTSTPATLTVQAVPVIVAEPQSGAVIDGSNMTLTVTAEGTSLAYQWYKGGVAMTNNGRITGATDTALTVLSVTTNDAAVYEVHIWNGVGSVSSPPAVVAVYIPARFTSATNAIGRQGAAFNHQVVAQGTKPIAFGAENLPAGLVIDSATGLVSGIPAVSGVFDVIFYATNAAMTTTQNFLISLTTGVPGITSSLTANGKQGVNFNYRINASNTPSWFTTSPLPAGLTLNPVNGRITGPPIVSGSFPVSITAGNAYGSDTEVLVINLASSIPVITSPLVATGTQNLGGFTYQIVASDNPLVYGVSELPLGLDFSPMTGVISGTPLYGGPFNIEISAANAWGTGKTNLLLDIAFETPRGLVITEVTNIYSSPYLLDFAFSLRDDADAGISDPVIRPVHNIQVTCLEDGVPIPSETAVVLEHASQKQMKMFLGLDYTWSMFAAPGAIEAMELAAKNLINVSPDHAQFGVVEFHAEYEDPIMVTDLTSDKTTLGELIDGIEENQVLGNYAGTRCWDAILLALEKFGPYDPEIHRDEQRFIVVMSDGNDASSLVNTNANPIDTLVTLAQANHVRVYCVAFGPDINTNALQQLTSQTLGRYYEAATTADLPLQFTRIARDLDGQYLLRWATLRRAPVEFQPSFVITVDGVTASFNTNVVYETNYTIITNTPPDPDITNTTITHITETAQYNPTEHAGDVRIGSLLLVADAQTGSQTVRLRASYVPRNVREIRLTYRPNYPCTATKSSSGPGEFLETWSFDETVDTNGLRTITLRSPNPTNQLTSLPYGMMGELIGFHFTYPDQLNPQKAFSSLTIDNTVYTNFLPAGIKFSLQNSNSFVTSYPLPPPHGTPIPWLEYYGFTGDLTAAELSDPNTNGMAVWQEYLAGLDPRDPTARFDVRLDLASTATNPVPPVITFPTVSSRTYRVEWSPTMQEWYILYDEVRGSGAEVSLPDLRNLSGVNSGFYRVLVY